MRWLCCSLLLGACASVPDLPQADTDGIGLTASDEQAPVGVEVWHRPQWRVGDRFTLVRGQLLRGDFEVVQAEGGVYTIDVGNGRLLRRDFDLGNLGEWSQADDQPLRVMTPVDVRYHWPLWVGKRWQCEFIDRVSGGEALRMSASYHVEAMDSVQVPAGEFRALRIVRTLRLLAKDGDFLTRTQMAWFAPDAGLEVRQLLGDTLVELVAWQRGPEAAGATGEPQQ